MLGGGRWTSHEGKMGHDVFFFLNFSMAREHWGDF